MRYYKNNGIEVLVQKIAHTLASGLPEHIDFEDLLQAGMVGWMYAKTKFDESKNIPFEHYAGRCIKGHILDSLRDGSWATREMTKAWTDRRKAYERLCYKGIIDPSYRQVADELGLSLDEYCKLNEQLANLNTRSDYVLKDDGDDYQLEIPDPNTPASAEIIQEFNMFEQLEEALASLSATERTIIELYHKEQVHPVQIGAQLGLIERDVRRSIHKVMSFLSRAMKDYA